MQQYLLTKQGKQQNKNLKVNENKPNRYNNNHNNSTQVQIHAKSENNPLDC